MAGGRPDAFALRLSRLLQPLGPVRPRAMFGGWGLFLEDAMFAILVGERLYFKVDPGNLRPFEEAGCAAFTYLRNGRPVALSFREAPAACAEAPETLLAWARLALPAAERARAKRRSRKGRR